MTKHGVDWFSRLKTLRLSVSQHKWGNSNVDKFREIADFTKIERELLIDVYSGIDVLNRLTGVKEWVQSWASKKVEFLEPFDWFRRGHDWDGGSVHDDGLWRPNIKAGIFCWDPPPTTADVALEELRKARIKRQTSTQVYICPVLMSPV